MDFVDLPSGKKNHSEPFYFVVGQFLEMLIRRGYGRFSTHELQASGKRRLLLPTSLNKNPFMSESPR